jgi:hypothetical protein
MSQSGPTAPIRGQIPSKRRHQASHDLTDGDRCRHARPCSAARWTALRPSRRVTTRVGFSSLMQAPGFKPPARAPLGVIHHTSVTSRPPSESSSRNSVISHFSRPLKSSLELLKSFLKITDTPLLPVPILIIYRDPPCRKVNRNAPSESALACCFAALRTTVLT